MESLRPAGKFRGVFFDKRIKKQRGQGKIIYHLGLIAAIAKIADVLGMGDICFGDNHDIRCHHIQYASEQFNHVVDLAQVDAICADFLPQIGNCIQPQDGCALLHIVQKYFDHFFKYIQAFKIEIDLIGTEGGP
jgi:hypothetical protein